MEELHLNMLQSTCLELLGVYGYLTVSQFQMLTGKSAGYIREMLGSLSRRGFVRSFRIEVSYKVRSENMYVNAPLAVEYLTSHKNIVTSDIKTTTTQVVVKDFFHRFHTINVNILLRRHLIAQGLPVNTMLSYFDKQGAAKKGTLVSRIRIPLDGQNSFIPDTVFVTEKGLYLVECYCDKDTKRIINQLGLHAKAISLGTPASTFNMPKTNPFVLAAFVHPGIQQAVASRLRNNPSFQNLSHLYFFASLDQLKENCATAWKDINDNLLIFK